MDNVEELFQRLHLKTWLSQNGERYLDPIRNTFIKPESVKLIFVTKSTGPITKRLDGH